MSRKHMVALPLTNLKTRTAHTVGIPIDAISGVFPFLKEGAIKVEGKSYITFYHESFWTPAMPGLVEERENLRQATIPLSVNEIINIMNSEVD